MKEITKNNNIREKLSGNQAPLKNYIDLTVGGTGFLNFIKYEFLTCLFGFIPGGIGYYLRKKFYPLLLKRTGNGLIIGRNVVIRHPSNIELGDNVTIDDNCVIDGRGAGPEGVILEDNVMINRNCMILAKAGHIRFGRRTSIGCNSVVVSMDGVELGEAVLIAGGCYISAGSYGFDDINEFVMDQKAYSAGPIRIGSGAWLGTRVTVLDGVSIGKGAIIGACALVNKNIPENAVAYGVPVKVVRIRK